MQHLTEYINHHGPLDAAATNHLRAMVERYPYYHAARILWLRALHAAHDPRFTAELKLAAIHVPSRTTLYDMIEAHRLRPQPEQPQRRLSRAAQQRAAQPQPAADRTGSLIDSFLSTLPQDQPQRRPRTVDATQDYMAYLMQLEQDQPAPSPVIPTTPAGGSSALTRQDLIDNFIDSQGDRRIQLDDRTDDELEKPQLGDAEGTGDDVFTETLARIYIKQGKFDKAIEIIRRLSLKYPKKNRYFADQIRFLEKLILNNNTK